MPIITLQPSASVRGRQTLPARLAAPASITPAQVLEALNASLPDLPEGWVGLTEDNKPIFSGNVLFDLKATHGLPLDFALDRIINDRGWAVGWPDFVAAARANKWYDYQTYEAVSHAVADAMLPKPTQEGILAGLRLYIMSSK